MIVVIQCAAKKQPHAGHLRDGKDRAVLFVADPRLAPPSDSIVYARPDDASDYGPSWRDMLRRYNESPGANELNLCKAIDLYCNPAYSRLARQMRPDQVYVLSAGWGLIRSDFLTPNYDITFSNSADQYKRRRRTDSFGDVCMLPASTKEPIFFFGGKDYLPLFCELTRHLEASRTVFYNSETKPDAAGCSLVRFQTATRTNWHYECLNAFLDGKVF